MRDQSCPGWASAGPCPRLITTRRGLDTSLQSEPSSTCTGIAPTPPALPLGRTPGHEGVHLLTRLPGTGGQDTQPSSILQISHGWFEWIREVREESGSESSSEVKAPRERKPSASEQKGRKAPTPSHYCLESISSLRPAVGALSPQRL